MLTKKLLKTARVAYVYADGHAAVVHRKKDPDVGELDFVTLHETLGFTIRHLTLKNTLAERGRLIVSEGAVHMLPHLKTLGWSDIHGEHGSPNTQKQGIRLGTISVNFSDDWRGETYFPVIDGLSSNWTPQCEARHSRTWAEAMRDDSHSWSGMPVASIYRAEARKAA